MQSSMIEWETKQQINNNGILNFIEETINLISIQSWVPFQ